MGIITAMGMSKCGNLLTAHSPDAVKLSGLAPTFSNEVFLARH